MLYLKFMKWGSRFPGFLNYANVFPYIYHMQHNIIIRIGEAHKFLLTKCGFNSTS